MLGELKQKKARKYKITSDKRQSRLLERIKKKPTQNIRRFEWKFYDDQYEAGQREEEEEEDKDKKEEEKKAVEQHGDHAEEAPKDTDEEGAEHVEEEKDTTMTSPVVGRGRDEE